MTFVPDEEIGGIDGMKAFAQTEFFKKLNVGFFIDEGETSARENTFFVLYGERVIWRKINYIL